MKQQIKTITITADSSHPFFGTHARAIMRFSSKLKQRPEVALQIVQDILHSNDCVKCGKCCTSEFYGFLPVYPDDQLFRIRLEKDRLELSDKTPNFERLRFSKPGPRGHRTCPYLEENGCNGYIDRPSVCRTYPVDINSITELGLNFGLTVLVNTCPGIRKIHDAGIEIVYLSDVIFRISDALANPFKYANEQRVEKLVKDLEKLKKKGQKYYVSPLLGSSLLENLRLHKEGLNAIKYTPFIMHDGEVCFIIKNYQKK